MEYLAQLLKEHFNNHPDMEVRDAVKFLYQSYLGGGHLIVDERAALTRLEEEWSRVEGDPDAPLAEPLGHGRSRLHLNACKGKGLSVATVCRLFLLSARETVPDQEGFRQALELVRSLPFSGEMAEGYLAEYQAQGCPMVSHSEAYRTAYAPAYRIVSDYYIGLIPVLAAVDHALQNGPLRAAIDGPCASGKSTLGQTLVRIYGCPLLHMDDFFLRPDQRTEARLAQPGGNVDAERFFGEVLGPLCRNETARYRPWRCRDGDFGPERTVDPSPLIVVEGSYSLRPDLREAYGLRIWVEAPWPVREQRLAQRGPGCLERFKQVWVPLENQYFQACRVKECCHITVSGGKP